MSERCPVCDWPMATTLREGCVPGNCSHRPTPGSAEYERIQRRKEQLAWQKLVDLPETAVRQHAALEAFLTRHRIVWARYTSEFANTDPRFPEVGYRRYSVQASDLCCAQAVLGAVEALADDDDDPPEAA